MTYRPHSAKQETVLFSPKRIVIAGTGIQWGKTASGVVWLKMMMHRFRAPSDNFLVCSPTYKILEQSTLPPFLEINEGCGRLDRGNMCFHINGGGKVWFRTGRDPDSVVGITNVRAVLCDEAGKYSRYFWDNIQARASFKEAPIRIVTSPYSLNWLATDFIIPHRKNDEYIRQLCDIVQARSDENPYFPRGEYEARQRTMDPRRFNMIYGGKFDKADGLVYDCFDAGIHTIDKFQLPAGTKVVAGVDWGYRDPFVISVRALTPDGIHYRIGEFYKTQQTIENMVDAASRLKDLHGIEKFYCDPSRPAYISHFCSKGLNAIGAENDVRLGIDRHYELINSGRYYVFSGTSPHLLDEYENYHYPEPSDIKLDAAEKDELPVDNSNHCIAEGQLVETINGRIPVEKIKSGDMVLTRAGFRKVLFAGKTGLNRDLMEIRAGDALLICTPCHLVHTRRGFLRADAVRYSDIVTTTRRKSCWPKKSNGMEKHTDAILSQKGEQTGFITNAKTNICTGKSGGPVTAIFQRACTFITSTTTLKTTQLKILRQSIPESMRQDISGARKDQPGRKSIWHQFLKRLLTGTNQSKEGNGINANGNGLLAELRKSIEIATNAAFHLLSRTVQKGGVSAHESARRRTEGQAASTMSCENVRCAAVDSWSTNTRKPQLVPSPVQSIRRRKEKADVYDLTIEDKHEFFAGGMLVHNCMDAERYATMAVYRPIGHKRKRIITPGEAPRGHTRSIHYDSELENLKKRKRRNYADIPL